MESRPVILEHARELLREGDRPRSSSRGHQRPVILANPFSRMVPPRYASAVRKLVIPGTALQTSRFIFGTSSLLSVGSRRRRQRLLGAAVAQGFTHFDTAPYYGFGAAERDLAPVLRTQPDIGVTTKVGIYPRGGAEQPTLTVIAPQGRCQDLSQSRSSDQVIRPRPGAALSGRQPAPPGPGLHRPLHAARA